MRIFTEIILLLLVKCIRTVAPKLKKQTSDIKHYRNTFIFMLSCRIDYTDLMLSLLKRKKKRMKFSFKNIDCLLSQDNVWINFVLFIKYRSAPTEKVWCEFIIFFV